MTDELKKLQEIVKKAAALIGDDFYIERKDNSNFNLVTEEDIKVETFLISEIKKAYPTFDIVSEETNSKKQLTENCFTIDPIDGTNNFAAGNPLWVIQVCCIKEGKSALAVIYSVKLDEMFAADETGAYLNGKKISVSKDSVCDSTLFVETNLKKERLEFLLKMSKVTSSCRQHGSIGFSLAAMAAGRVEGGAFLSHDPNSWDIQPGMFIINKAGGYFECKKEEYAIFANTKELLNELKKCKK